MPACFLSCRLAEIFALLVVLVVVANALGLMVGVLKPAEALRCVVIALSLCAVLAVLVVMLLQIWSDLTILQKIGVTAIGLALLLRTVRQCRARRKPNPKSGQ